MGPAAFGPQAVLRVPVMSSVSHRPVRLPSATVPGDSTTSIEQTGFHAKMPVNRWIPEFRGLRTPTWRMVVLLTIPALVALGVSIYLGYVAFTKSPVAGCGGGLFDCNHVLNSKWSSFFGIPVAVLAAVTYVGMLLGLGCSLLTRHGSPLNRLAWMAIATLGLSAGLAALWFISLQVFAIGHYCPWCLTAHACGLAIATALLVRRPFGWKPASSLATVAAGGLAVMITVQFTSPEPPKFEEVRHEMIVKPGQPTSVVPGDTPVFGAPVEEESREFEPPVFDPPFDASVPRELNRMQAAISGLGAMAVLLRPGLMTTLTSVSTLPQDSDDPPADDSSQPQTANPERRLISISGGTVQLDVRQWPLIGKPDAQYVFVEMFDYACPHCRNTHRAIDEACRTLGDELAIIVLPVPLNRNCNDAVARTDAKFTESCDMARLAVACWRVNPEGFQKFHAWMFEGNTPSYAAAKRRAEELVGKESIDSELARKAPGQYVAKHVELYKMVGQGNVPKLLFPGTSIVGEYTSGSSLVDKIRREAR